MSISSKAMTITGIDDRRYWSHLAIEESSTLPFLFTVRFSLSVMEHIMISDWANHPLPHLFVD